MKQQTAIKVTAGRKAFLVCNYLFFTLLILICAYPLWYVFVQSLSGEIVAGKGIVVPYRFTLKNYQQVMKLKGLGTAFKISAARTGLGCLITVTCCMMLGYLFSKEEMPFRRLLYRMLVICMYISGGLIPSYLTVKYVGLMNSFWVYIIPWAVNAYNVVLVKTFVEQLPASVEESAMLDGAGVFTILFRIILPMSLPILATIAVYSSVAQWNSWFDNHLYTAFDENLTTLQYMLYNYLNQAERLSQLLAEGKNLNSDQILTPKGVRMTVTMITVIPVLCIYPFLQRYFVKGIMIGAVKG
ncbi:MAG: carbohydrate ABC transporter permease [Christensenellales bacterium]|jgi:putative aldouronate transport system permease protein